jgi:P27 family predicted phage terminase small subunit
VKGAKPNLTGNVIPMKGDAARPVLDPPDLMGEQAKEIWDELAPVLSSKGRLEPHFRYQFASYCEAVATFMAATNDLVLQGIWYEVKTRNGLQQKKTQAFLIQQDAANQMRRDAAMFGLTPVDEARLGGEGQGDLFEQVMSQLKGGKSGAD